MTVVFFCPNILRNAHRSIFDLDRLKEQGFDIVLLDASSYYGNDKFRGTDELIIEHRVICSELEDFEQFRENLPEDPVLFVTFDNYMKFAAPILKLMIRKKDRLLTYHTKRSSDVENPNGKFRKKINEIVRFLDKHLPLHHLKFYYRKRHKFYIPDYFLCSTEYLIPTKVFFSIKRQNRITVHADDINETFRTDKEIIGKGRRFGVFLDQGIPFIKQTHPLQFKGEDPLPDGYLETYYENLESSLRRLKKELDLDEVVISLHPVALRFEEELKDKFSGFRTFMGTTKDLVRDAQVVFGHYSTAINFAVFYKKPVVILTDDVLLNAHPIIRDHILFYPQELGMINYPMDRDESTILEENLLDYEKYEEYTRKFLKDNAIEENSYFYAINRIVKDMNNIKGTA